MEAKLKKLFDYQRFSHDPRLDRLIAETEARQETELDDDALELVSAAGEVEGRTGPLYSRNDHFTESEH